MFESALITALKADATLTALLSSFGGSPAIFVEIAPETAELPYVVFKITRTSTESAAVQSFNITIDVFGYDTTAKNARLASEEIETLLDRGYLEHERYGCIRLFFYSSGPVEDYEDPRSIHINLLFDARAGRKKWSANQTTLGY